MSPTLRQTRNNSSIIDKLQTTVDNNTSATILFNNKSFDHTSMYSRINTTQMVFAKSQLAKLINPQSEILPKRGILQQDDNLQIQRNALTNEMQKPKVLK